jgi:hypothetical protein
MRHTAVVDRSARARRVDGDVKSSSAWLIAAALIAMLRSLTRLWVTLAVAEGVAFVAMVYNGEGKSVVVLVAALTRSLDAALRVLVRRRPA